jgi:hypothetical protein
VAFAATIGLRSDPCCESHRQHACCRPARGEWIDHLRRTDPELSVLLDEGRVLVHPFVIGWARR